MLKFNLSKRTESLKPYLRDLLIYSGIDSAVVEIGSERRSADSIFINEDECETLEDVLSKFALSIYSPTTHKKRTNASVISLSSKYGDSRSRRIASVIETAIEPVCFFTLDRVPLR